MCTRYTGETAPGMSRCEALILSQLCFLPYSSSDLGLYTSQGTIEKPVGIFNMCGTICAFF